MASLWNLDACTAWLAQKFPGVLKTSNQFYRAVLTPRNLAAPMKVHDHNIFDWFIKLHTVTRAKMLKVLDVILLLLQLTSTADIKISKPMSRVVMKCV